MTYAKSRDEKLETETESRDSITVKYMSSHFLTLTVEVLLVRCGLDTSFTFELRCSLPSTPSLLLLFRFT